MAYHRPLKLHEIVALLEENDDDIIESDIVLNPPINPYLSDEDSGAEEEADINSLSGNQLLAQVEAHLLKKTDDGIERIIFGVSDDNDAGTCLPTPGTSTTTADSSSATVNTSSTTTGTSSAAVAAVGTSLLAPGGSSATSGTSSLKLKCLAKQRPVRKWIRTDISPKPEREWTLPPFCQQDKAPNEWFELFFDPSVIEHIRASCVTYAIQMGKPNFTITSSELTGFLGILLLSGYISPSRYRLWWDNSVDTHHSGVAAIMSRNRFEEILRFFHVCDNNNLPKDDKFAKVRPLWNLLNKRWMEFFPGEGYLSIDESMVPYFGRHSTKQHLHGKPIRFGYKVWSMCTRLGYLVQAEPYQGASTGNTMPHLGVGGSVVMTLVNSLPQDQKFSIYIDNFFTSVDLLEELQMQGHDGTGTIRQNSVGNAPLKDIKAMKKGVRGNYDKVTDEKSGVTLVRYFDNNVVTVASTKCGVEPIGKATRWSLKDLKKIGIDQPFCVGQYNQYMGGVDRLDQNISKYRVAIRMKKWYWQLLMFLLNASMNNAFQLFRLSPDGRAKNALDYLGFLRQVVQTYMMRSTLPRPRAGRSSQSAKRRVPDSVRLDGVDHLITSNRTQIRCGECRKNTLKKCLKCGVGCHVNCFVKFHK